ncbi:acyl-CoA thioesterase [Azohydromonas lata]|uniref:Thioesterase family protein n=1 Tax=Azohydromonas lata TaxID=45677 RepID=A0ABU5ICA4_9BURK|nr:acyl-CoA thioesterase domain-containing protein [Azohydromonas lata]MDZ5456170.1 thioesterase family protein [Azohydromonas lata]
MSDQHRPLNTVQPDLAPPRAGWDRHELAQLLTPEPGADGVLANDRVATNVNGAIFGGQLIGQALMAAAHGLGRAMAAHSLHLNFLAPGLADQPLQFDVRRLLSGLNFITQHVIGRQGERLVFSANVSFHRGEPGPVTGSTLPDGVPPPEDLPSLREAVQHLADRLDPAARERMGGSRSLEMRPLDAEHFLLHREPSGTLRYWIRASDELGDAPNLHRAALGYLSDYWFPMVALAPLLDARTGTGLYVASLNHALWFHAPVRADEWLLVEAQAAANASARGLTQGKVWNREGTLVASVAQESLFRGWVPGEDGAFTAPYSQRKAGDGALAVRAAKKA